MKLLVKGSLKLEFSFLNIHEFFVFAFLDMYVQLLE